MFISARVLMTYKCKCTEEYSAYTWTDTGPDFRHAHLYTQYM